MLEGLEGRSGLPKRNADESWAAYVDRVSDQLGEDLRVRAKAAAKVLARTRRTITDNAIHKLMAFRPGQRMELVWWLGLITSFAPCHSLAATRTHAEAVTLQRRDHQQGAPAASSGPAVSSSARTNVGAPKRRTADREDSMQTAAAAGAALGSVVIRARQQAETAGAAPPPPPNKKIRQTVR